YGGRSRGCGRERWRGDETAYGEPADHLLRETDPSGCQEAIRPLLGQLARLAEDDRHGREPNLTFGDPVSHHAGPHTVEREDLRVAVLDDHRRTWDRGQLRELEFQFARRQRGDEI